MAPTPQSQSQELNVKLLLIGNSSVGKSNLRFSYKQWLLEDEASATIGIDFWVRSQYLSLSLRYIDDDHDVVAFVAVALGFSTLRCWGITILSTRAGVLGRKFKMSKWVRSLAFLPLPCPPGVFSLCPPLLRGWGRDRC